MVPGRKGITMAVQGKIQVLVKNVYGEDKAYPVDSAGQLIARIAGTKTLTRSALCNVLEMGLAIELVDRFGSVLATFKADNSCRLLATIR
jgi:hypothetical protein